MSRRPGKRPSPVGQSLCQIVRARPGIHFRDLGRAAGLASSGQLRHHLDSLRRQGLVVEVPDGRFRRYFAPDQHGARVHGCMARFARPVPRRIGRMLLDGPMTRTALRRSLGMADSTLGYHLARMVRTQDLQKQRGRNCCNYSLVDPQGVSQAMRLQAADGVPAAGAVGPARAGAGAIDASPSQPNEANATAHTAAGSSAATAGPTGETAATPTAQPAAEAGAAADALAAPAGAGGASPTLSGVAAAGSAAASAGFDAALVDGAAPGVVASFGTRQGLTATAARLQETADAANACETL